MGQERRGTQSERTVVAVGLTGSIGAGKSTALELFREYGAQVASADCLVHELYGHPEMAARVADHFGAQVLDAQGAVDRARLAEAVRGRPEQLHWLEQLTHPWVAEEIARRVASASRGSLLVFEVPLLFEAGYEHLFDLIVTIEAGSEIRRRRSTHEFDLRQFAELEALQASQEQRVQRSDLVIVNDGTPAELRESVKAAYAVAMGMMRASSEVGEV